MLTKYRPKRMSCNHDASNDWYLSFALLFICFIYLLFSDLLKVQFIRFHEREKKRYYLITTYPASVKSSFMPCVTVRSGPLLRCSIQTKFQENVCSSFWHTDISTIIRKMENYIVDVKVNYLVSECGNQNWHMVIFQKYWVCINNQFSVRVWQ